MLRRPDRDELAAAAGTGRTIPDVIAPDLRVLFCGINPGLYSGATGFPFARPGNRFWRVLHGAGFTDRILLPSEGDALLERGIGVTNVVARTTATAAEPSDAEIRLGAELLRTRVLEFRPAWLAVLGLTAYRVGFDAPKAVVGRQAARVGRTGIWVLPNPSGLNAHYQAPALIAAFAELRAAAFAEPG